MKHLNRLKIYLHLSIYATFLSQTKSLSDFSVNSFLSQKEGEAHGSSFSLLRSSLPVYTPLGGSGTRHQACHVGGKTGVCMFTWECVNAGGTPLGVCKEGLTFGACCTTPTYVSPLTKVKVASDGQIKPVSYGTHQCGIVSDIFVRRKGHVYNGQDVQFGEFPWMVNLRRVTYVEKTAHWCGGALLTNEWVISAAHCFHRVHPANIIARLGELSFDNPNKKFPYVERRMGKKFQHPKYLKLTNGLSDYDITLLKMDKPVRFQPHISPICLPPFNSFITEGEAIVTGWGKTENKTASKVLQKVTVPILPNDKCISMMEEEGYQSSFSNKLFCAGYSTGVKDACQGDSGGPLQMKGENGRYFIVGIVSTGIGCAKPNFPGIYLRVSPYLSWALEVMSDN